MFAACRQAYWYNPFLEQLDLQLNLKMCITYPAASLLGVKPREGFKSLCIRTPSQRILSSHCDEIVKMLINIGMNE